MNIKKGQRGFLNDGTFYIIKEDENNTKQLMINGRVWHSGNPESIQDYISKLNKE